jgi:hypothetical protein
MRRGLPSASACLLINLTIKGGALAGLKAVVAHTERVRSEPLVQCVLAKERAFVAALEKGGTAIPTFFRSRMILE